MSGKLSTTIHHNFKFSVGKKGHFDMISVFCNSFSQKSCSLVEKWRQDPSGRCSKFRQNQSRDTVALARWHRYGSRDGSTHAQLSDRWSA